MTDPYATIASPAYVYGPGSPYTGQPVSPGQAAYAGSAAPPTPGAAPGSDARTPEYQTPGSGSGAGYYVDQPGQLHVPDTDPYAHIAGIDLNSDPRMPAYEDASRSFVTGLEKGAAGLVGLGGDIKNLWGAGVEGGATWLGRQLGIFTPEQIAAQDAAAKGAPENFAHEAGSIDSGDVNGVLQSALGPYHDPQTAAGRFTQTLGQFIPGAGFGGAGLAAKAGGTLAAATGSDVAGELTRGTPLEPWARALGGLGGAGIAQGVRSVAEAPMRLVGQAMSEATPGQIGQASALMRASPVPLTTAEALQQVTGGATGMGRLQHFWENSLPGGEVARPFFAQRPGAVAQATSDFADKIAPPSVEPSMLGRALQSSAQSLIDRAKSYRTQSVNPLYEAANPQTVPHEEMSGLLSNIDAQITSDKTGILAKPLIDLRSKLIDHDATAAAQAAQAPSTVSIGGQSVPVSSLPPQVQQAVGVSGAPAGGPADLRIPITDIENLDRTRKFVRDNTAAQIERGRMTPEQGAALFTHLDHLDAMMENYSPEFVQGKALYGSMSDKYVTPLEAGPIGKIAGSNSIGSQTRALYPAQPAEGQAAETGAAVRMMTGDPSASEPFGGLYPTTLNRDLAAALTRQHVVNTADTALSDLQGGG